MSDSTDRSTSHTTQDTAVTLPAKIRQYYVVWLILFMSIAAVAWVAVDGYQAHAGKRAIYTEKMQSAVDSVTRQVEIQLQNLRISIQLFADDHSELLRQLKTGDDNEAILLQLSDKLGEYLPAYHSITVSDAVGNLLFDDFGEKVGPLCRSELAAYAISREEHRPYIHPGPQAYHFDLMVPWGHPRDEGGIFFASFTPDLISRIIHDNESPGYNLYLVREDVPDLIEIGSQGSRNRMDGEHRLALLEAVDVRESRVRDTRWIVKAILDENYLLQSRDEILVHRATIAALLLLIATLLSFLVFKIESRRFRSEQAEHAAKEAAETANRAKTEFLSSMSHELRTPLNAIIGFGQVLDMKYSRISPEKTHEYINAIMKAGHHLLELINEILDLSRIEAGHLNIEREGVNLKQISADCFAQIEAGLAVKYRVTLVNHVDDESLVACADRLRLKQVLINLMSNAVKYNREGGYVTVDARRVDDNRLRIEVSDTGEGIPRDDIEKIFDPFERLGQKNSSIEGTGVGLTVTRRLVEAMDGEIGVASTVGQGTMFWLELQRWQQDSDTAPADLPPAEPGKRDKSALKVLCIEDNAANRERVMSALTEHGDFRAWASPTAEEGITVAEEELPDVILMDIELPGIDGYLALEILQAIETTRDIPVIALAAREMECDTDRIRAAGFSGCLTRPVDHDALYAAIDKCGLDEPADRSAVSR